jgi:hypothetical protein
MAIGLQDVLATASAIAALVVIVRRVAGAVRPDQNPACANCPLVKDAARTAR